MNRETQTYYWVLKLCYDAMRGRKATSSQHQGTQLCGDCTPICPVLESSGTHLTPVSNALLQYLTEPVRGTGGSQCPFCRGLRLLQ